MDEQSEFDDKTSLTSHGSNTTDIDKVRLWLYFVSLARASAGAINQILIRSRIIYIDSAGEEEMHKDVSFIHLFLSSSFFKERILDLSFFFDFVHASNLFSREWFERFLFISYIAHLLDVTIDVSERILTA